MVGLVVGVGLIVGVGVAPVQRANDALGLLELAGLEQAVRLVDDEKLDARKGALHLGVAVHELPQAARRANDNVGPLQLPPLLLDAQAARHDANVGRRRQPAAERLEVVAQLLGQLPRRAQHQRHGAPFRPCRAVRAVAVAVVQLEPLVDHGDAKGQRLARARLSLANHVAAGQYLGDGLFLDRRRRREAELGNGREHARREIQGHPGRHVDARVPVVILGIGERRERVAAAPYLGLVCGGRLQGGGGGGLVLLLLLLRRLAFFLLGLGLGRVRAATSRTSASVLGASSVFEMDSFALDRVVAKPLKGLLLLVVDRPLGAVAVDGLLSAVAAARASRNAIRAVANHKPHALARVLDHVDAANHLEPAKIFLPDRAPCERRDVDDAARRLRPRLRLGPRLRRASPQRRPLGPLRLGARRAG